MSHEMFEGSLYLPSDAREVESIVKTGKVPVPTSKEYGRGAVVFPSVQEARKDAFSSGLIGGRNNPEASLARVARVSVRPDNPLIVGSSDRATYHPQYKDIADRLIHHYESDEVQQSVEQKLRSGSVNNQFTSSEAREAMARTRALTSPQGRSSMVHDTMTSIIRGSLSEASRVTDTLKLPYDAVGNPSTGSAVAKKSEIIKLKNVRPLS